MRRRAEVEWKFGGVSRSSFRLQAVDRHLSTSFQKFLLVLGGTPLSLRRAWSERLMDAPTTPFRKAFRDVPPHLDIREGPLNSEDRLKAGLRT